MSFSATHLIGFGAGGSDSIVATYTDSSSSPSNLTTYTFTAANLGTAFSTRRIVVVVFGNNTATITGITIGGVTATLLYSAGDSAVQPGFWSAAVPSGSTGDVVVTFSGSNTACCIGVWSVAGWGGSVNATAKNGTTAVSNPSLSIAVAAGGCALAAVRNANSESFVGDWTGATERFNVGPSSPDLLVASGADVHSSTATTANISVTASNASRLTAISLA